MAVFLLKADLGPSYTPPPCVGTTWPGTDAPTVRVGVPGRAS